MNLLIPVCSQSAKCVVHDRHLLGINFGVKDKKPRVTSF